MPNKVEDNKHKSIKQREQLDGYWEQYQKELDEFFEDCKESFLELPVDKKKKE